MDASDELPQIDVTLVLPAAVVDHLVRCLGACRFDQVEGVIAAIRAQAAPQLARAMMLEAVPERAADKAN